jgi:hypothetical protein
MGTLLTQEEPAMRSLAALLCLALFGPALADDPKPWPQKGDIVYVAAVLPAVSMPIEQGEKLADLLELPACSPLDVGFHKKRIGFGDASGSARILEGDWKRAMFASREECLRAPLVPVKVHWRYGGDLPVYTIPTPKAVSAPQQ